MPKWYVVWIGRDPGIYQSWKECSNQVDGFKGAKFKSFPTREEAKEAFKTSLHSSSHLYNSIPKQKMKSTAVVSSTPNLLVNECSPLPMLHPTFPSKWALTVDAACNGTKAIGEARGVLIPDGNQVFRVGPWPFCTNNIMEFIAIIKGLQWIWDKGVRVPIYSDSNTAIGWVHRGICNTQNKPPFGSIVDAEINACTKWLSITRQQCPELLDLITKWDTAKYGEIPSDFGRK
jgi:ribonuclease HI